MKAGWLAVAGMLLLSHLPSAVAALLYDAPLRSGNYGGGFKVGVYSAGSPWNASGSSGGTLAPLGIIDSPSSVVFTTNNDVINFSLGAQGLGGPSRSTFRVTGTVSVLFRALSDSFVTGQLFVDNYGFNQFNSGQATFSSALIRQAGADTKLNSSDDLVELAWNSWHNNVWYEHVNTAADQVVTTMDRWHHLGLTWGGANRWEVWLDGELVAVDNRNLGAWGSNFLGLGSAYNFALGEIHERSVANSSVRGVEFASLRIWDEVRPFGDTSRPIPEPCTGGLVAIAIACGLWRHTIRTKCR